MKIIILINNKNSKIYIKQSMAGITQKELKKPYFHCGPFTMRKVLVKGKRF